MLRVAGRRLGLTSPRANPVASFFVAGSPPIHGDRVSRDYSSPVESPLAVHSAFIGAIRGMGIMDFWFSGFLCVVESRRCAKNRFFSSYAFFLDMSYDM